MVSDLTETASVQLKDDRAVAPRPPQPRQVVVLIDECDKPLLGNLYTPEVTTFKNALKAFDSVVKIVRNV